MQNKNDIENLRQATFSWSTLTYQYTNKCKGAQNEG